MFEKIGALLSLAPSLINYIKERSSRQQKEILECIDLLINSDPRKQTKADSILENDCFDRLAKAGIPEYLLQHPIELNECKKLITRYGLKEGVKKIREDGAGLANI